MYLVGYTKVLKNDEFIDLGYAPLDSELRRLRSVYARTRFGWPRWMEEFRRDELIYMLSFNVVSEFLGYDFAVKYSRYLRLLSEVASSISGRGGDPRGLAAAVACYVSRVLASDRSPLYVFYLRSSRASFYRALKLFTLRLGHSELFYRLLLSGLSRCNYRVYDERLYVPKRSLVVLRNKSLKVFIERVVRGFMRVPSVNSPVSIEVYCLPENSILMGDSMATVELKMRFRVLDLLDLLRRRLGDTFTAKDVAEILATDSRYAGRLLSLLAKEGYLEIVSDKPRKYRIVRSD